MNSYKKYFLSKNRMPLILMFFILSLMVVRNLIFNLFCMLILPFVIISWVKNFDMASYKVEDGEEDHQMLIDLLPIDKSRYKILCMMNALMWSMILFLVSVLYLNSIVTGDYQISAMLLTLNFISCLLIVVAEIIHIYLKKINQGIYILISVFVCLWLTLGMVIVLEANTISELNMFITIIMTWLMIVLIECVLEKISKNERVVKSFLTSRLDAIYDASTYNLTKKKLDNMNYLTIAIIISYNFDESYLIACTVIFSALCYLNFKQYFENQTYLQLLPISLKEKKISCFVTTLVQILVTTLAVYLLYLLVNKGSYVNLMDSAMTILVSLTINFFLFSCYNFYYHKQKDTFVFVLLLAIFGVTVAIYVYFQSIIPIGLYIFSIVLVSMGLFVYDYKRN